MVLRLALYFLLAYGGFCILIFFLQRKLIYMPTQTGPLNPKSFGFPHGLAVSIQTNTSDGVRLGGWLVAPRTQSPSDPHDALPMAGKVILFFHGNGGHRGDRIDLFNLLANLGYPSICFDYRGYGDSEGAPSEEGLALDARAAWAWLMDRGVSREKAVLYGESLGSGVAVRLAWELSQAGTPPGGLIVEGAFNRLADAAQHHFSFLPVGLILRDRYPSQERLPAVTCPLLAFHAPSDRVVPFHLGRRLFDSAPEKAAGGQPKRLVEVPGADHNDLRILGREKVSQALKNFLGGNELK